MTHYYVYYRVDPESVDELAANVRKLMLSIERQTGVRGRWMRRRDDPGTYMEVYESVADQKTFEAVLEREGAALGVPRKAEIFVSVVS